MLVSLSVLLSAVPVLIQVQTKVVCGGIFVNSSGLPIVADYVITAKQKHCFPSDPRVHWMEGPALKASAVRSGEEKGAQSFSVSAKLGDIGALALPYGSYPIGVPLAQPAVSKAAKLSLTRAGAIVSIPLTAKVWAACKAARVVVTFAKSPLCFWSDDKKLGDGDSGSPVLQDGKLIGVVSEIEPVAGKGSFVAVQGLPASFPATLKQCSKGATTCLQGGGASLQVN